ncbi:MAG: hypothetical protein RBG13Loki_0014, partial [Promethearchaeota archaeon CR_4]
MQAFILSCYNSSSHLFADSATNAVENGTRVSGYSVIEATYYALATLDLLSALQPVVWQETANSIFTLQDESGGFACRPGVCTTHDGFFGYNIMQILGNTEIINVDALVNFLDARQVADTSRWWEYGAFTNLPVTIGQDTDFTYPNLVTSYYAIAALAACGRLGVVNEAALIQFVSLMKNMSSNLYSYAAGNEKAEHIGTAFLLALDQFFTNDNAIDYSTAATALLARVEVGNFNEGRRAPVNHTLSSACEMVWGLAEGERLDELTAATRARLRDFINLHYVTNESAGGFALTRL